MKFFKRKKKTEMKKKTDKGRIEMLYFIVCADVYIIW